MKRFACITVALMFAAGSSIAEGVPATPSDLPQSPSDAYVSDPVSSGYSFNRLRLTAASSEVAVGESVLLRLQANVDGEDGDAVPSFTISVNLKGMSSWKIRDVIESPYVAIAEGADTLQITVTGGVIRGGKVYVPVADNGQEALSLSLQVVPFAEQGEPVNVTWSLQGGVMQNLDQVKQIKFTCIEPVAENEDEEQDTLPAIDTQDEEQTEV